jgi:hypothetical protein
MMRIGLCGKRLRRRRERKRGKAQCRLLVLRTHTQENVRAVIGPPFITAVPLA